MVMVKLEHWATGRFEWWIAVIVDVFKSPILSWWAPPHADWGVEFRK